MPFSFSYHHYHYQCKQLPTYTWVTTKVHNTISPSHNESVYFSRRSHTIAHSSHKLCMTVFIQSSKSCNIARKQATFPPHTQRKHCRAAKRSFNSHGIATEGVRYVQMGVQKASIALALAHKTTQQLRGSRHRLSLCGELAFRLSPKRYTYGENSTAV